MAIVACLVGAIVPLLLLVWSESGAVVVALALFAVLLIGPVLLDRRMVDLDRANRLARAWVRSDPDPEQVALLARGPGRVADPIRAWRALARAGLLRRRSFYSTFGLASSPVNTLPTVYGGALLGAGFGLVSAVAVVVIGALRSQSPSLAALSVAGIMLLFAGVEFVARWAAIRAGERLAWLDVEDPRTLAGRRALHLLASAPEDIRETYRGTLAYPALVTPASWDEYRQSVLAGRRAHAPD
ncbi:hypothetical protein [Cryptosporangium sp. NPDC048952]|uniref:hypothetical protein n=1 Tax=Cryptosporangium sp. NPDC048952 TaxID=3363961 RepID=UPI003719F06B